MTRKIRHTIMGNTWDHRDTDKAKPILWAVATDRFMSGWGHAAHGASYVAYPIYDYEDERLLVNWMEERSDFMRVRVNLNLPRLGCNDHLSIYDRPLERWGAR